MPPHPPLTASNTQLNKVTLRKPQTPHQTKTTQFHPQKQKKKTLLFYKKTKYQNFTLDNSHKKPPIPQQTKTTQLSISGIKNISNKAISFNGDAKMQNPKVNVLPAQTLLQGMEQSFEQMNSILQLYGIEMYIYKVKTYKKEAEEFILNLKGKPIDEDAPDPRCVIDYIVRVKTKDPNIGMKLKEALLKEREQKEEGGK